MVFYQGPVPVDDESYIERNVVGRISAELLGQRWILFLGPRQHGKTTTLIRVRRNIEDAGLSCAYVDLQQQPPLTSYSGFISWFTGKIADQLGVEFQHDATMDDLHELISRALPEGTTRIVILIDEASNIQKDEWRNAFYGQLRGLSSARAFSKNTDASSRLTFLFAGTFRPETLIEAANSPFNVCEKIETEDLTVEEVRTLSEKIIGDPEKAQSTAEAIYEAVGGQPYLAQRLLGRAMMANELSEGLTDAIEELKSGKTDHIANLFSRFLAEDKLTKLVARLTEHGAIDNSPADPDYAFLCTGGLAFRDGQKLRFRNSVYEQVARLSPQIVGQAVAGDIAPLFVLPMDAFNKISDEEFRAIAYSAQRGAVAAHSAGSNRLALAGYGCSIEAILVDFLSGKSQQERQAAGQQENCRINRYENYADASSLRLVNLVKITNRILGSAGQVPDALRDWRNLIHPNLAKQNYTEDANLSPEVRAASALHEIFLRDLPLE